MATPEGNVKRKVSQLLKKYGAYYFMPVSSGLGKKSIDYFACYGGVFIGIETKAPGRKPTPLQESCMREIEAAGGYAFVIDGPVGLKRLEEMLRDLTHLSVDEATMYGQHRYER